MRSTTIRGLLCLLAIGGPTVAGCTQTATEDQSGQQDQGTQQAAESTTPAFPTGTIALADLPGYTRPIVTADGRLGREMIGGGQITWELLDRDGNRLADYQPEEHLAFGAAGSFTDLAGVSTFRGNHERTTSSYGTLPAVPSRLEVVWQKAVGSINALGATWTGAGWTGQASLVRWPEDTRKSMGLNETHDPSEDQVEVLYPVFAGNVHRLDLDTGADTRPPIAVGRGFKGAGSVDPRGYPLLFAGQGLGEDDGINGDWKLRVFNLMTNEEIAAIPGLDPAAPRRYWGAFDAAPLIHAGSDTMFAVGENGLIYKVKLNTNYDASAGTISVDLDPVRLRYQTPEVPPEVWRHPQ